MPPKDKKNDKKPEKPKGWDFDPIEAALVFIFLMALVSTLGVSVWRYITSGEISFFGFRFAGLVDFFKSYMWLWKTIAYVATGGLAIASFVFSKKGDAIWREEKAKIWPANMPTTTSGEQDNLLTKRWEGIVKLSESENSSDWRLAIIEADIMLDELLMMLRLPGDTMGDKLKAVEPSDFLSLNEAWEAHKARNMIAHEGSNFLLNDREARRLISLYETVFKEFKLI